MGNTIVRTANLPAKIKGIVVLDSNGDYNVYINNNVSDVGQGAAYMHEIEHIRHGHFYSHEDLEILEVQAEHGVVVEIRRKVLEY